MVERRQIPGLNHAYNAQEGESVWGHFTGDQIIGDDVPDWIKQPIRNRFILFGLVIFAKIALVFSCQKKLKKSALFVVLTGSRALHPKRVSRWVVLSIEVFVNPVASTPTNFVFFLVKRHGKSF